MNTSSAAQVLLHAQVAHVALVRLLLPHEARSDARPRPREELPSWIPPAWRARLWGHRGLRYGRPQVLRGLSRTHGAANHSATQLPGWLLVFPEYHDDM